MPKVSQAYRDARRDEIARAAMLRLSRQGFSGTSMADIIEESGLSAGAIYSHFSSKAEIAQHVARMVVGNRAEELVARAQAADPPLGPVEVISFVLDTTIAMGIHRSLLLQVWAEATVDPEFREILDETVGKLRRAYGDAITPWLQARGRPTDAAAVRAFADTMVALSQGFVVYSALFGADDPRAYLAGVAELLG
ncbi:MAG: TetR/AcrR family transcriptional regulator [Leifsonia sp.]